MPILNLMSDIVCSIVNEIFDREEDNVKDIPKDDIISYVLNRIPPKYCTSERGILHTILDTRCSSQTKTDIFFLVYEAVDIVKTRRKSIEHINENRESEQIAVFPHIMGMVLEKETLSIIPGVKITLLGGGKPAKMVDSGWNNPYITNLATKGYFHFWPDFTSAIERNENEFTIRIEHDDFETEEIVIRVDPIKELVAHESLSAPLVLINAKKGVDLSAYTDK